MQVAPQRRNVLLKTGLVLIFSLPAIAQNDRPNEISPAFWEVAGIRNSGSLNLRSGPSTQTRVVDRLVNGDVLRNRGCKESGGLTWCQVEQTDGGPNGWVAGRYLSETVDPQPPIAAENNDDAGDTSQQTAAAIAATQTAPADAPQQVDTDINDDTNDDGADDDATQAATATPPALKQEQPRPTIADGAVRCSFDGQKTAAGCEFRAVREGDGNARLWVTIDNSKERYFVFESGVLIQTDAASAFSYSRSDARYLIRIGGLERYEIPETAVFGG